jgi:hypothetical protein
MQLLELSAADERAVSPADAAEARTAWRCCAILNI